MIRREAVRIIGSIMCVSSPFCKYTAHLRCRNAKSVHPCTLLAASFGGTETSLLCNTSGIHAAAENARRTKSTPAGVFCALLASVLSLCKGLRSGYFLCV